MTREQEATRGLVFIYSQFEILAETVMFDYIFPLIFGFWIICFLFLTL
jgi:hypothetical protein